MSEQQSTEYCGRCGDKLCPNCGVCPWCVGHQDQPGDDGVEAASR